MKLCIISFSILLLFFNVNTDTYAEFYRYTDETGKIFFTDDLSKIPEPYREKINQYKEYKQPIPSTSIVSEPTDDTKPSISPKGDFIEFKNKEDLIEFKKKIQNQKKILDEEYNRLTTLKNELSQPLSDDSAQAQKDHNEKILNYNAQTKGYEEKRRQYEADLAMYNKYVEELNKTTEDQPGLETQKQNP